MDEKTYRQLSQEGLETWRLRLAKESARAQENAVAAESCAAKEPLPPARPPAFDDEEDRPISAQGAAIKRRK